MKTKTKTPKLKPIDLSKCCKKKDDGEGESWHPDIKVGKSYLAKVEGQYFAGYFEAEWYGWNFYGIYDSGIQLDKPGTNSSTWEGLWEIIN